MEHNYCVYMHTNKTNQKKYIGITSRTPNARWHNGQGYKRQRKFWNAIHKYGWDGFTHEILYTGLTLDEANAKEQELIKKFDSHYHGYNDTDGGDGSLGCKHSVEAKEKMSQSRKGRVIDEEWRKHLSEALKGKPHNISYTTLSESHKEKISESLKEYYRKNPNVFDGKIVNPPTPVICDGVTYDSVEKCADKYSVDKFSMYRWLSGKSYIPKEFVEKELRYKDTNPYYEELLTNRKKIFYNGTIYESMAQCASETHKAPKTLKSWINGTKFSDVEIYYVPVKKYKIKK